ncbi:phosphatidylinositol N-acetylglucosaminyltransferase subunit C-like isoform X2 [Glossina fuscipes]|uniref:Phosphatidylinositol N-acetylglucosaminyltransferase subunit C-like isoform X2 n=1 Tax=Glossina fuscipes TaxID=7396 RepID=A0A9C5ZMZ7_9MUSC|nr:phosphatidylinositol N-acetylglucosaminyltransferase subunit C-like isoform X2 [Glossina fuscipes]XP_037899305.1 phosphatidylinositol N-acetylglucosaminyltransferase subunit C-like isoform X2 [Glossina fuscipes]
MTTKRKPWRKNLYENSDYEDNYTDPSFLKDLKTNLHVRFFTLGEAIQVNESDPPQSYGQAL